MNGRAFTPGPWVVRKGKWGDLRIHAPTIEHKMGLDYIIIQDVGGDSTEAPKYGTPEGNACLIAAAPELLEALQIARDYAAYAQAEADDLALIDAAIAKATGAHS